MEIGLTMSLALMTISLQVFKSNIMILDQEIMMISELLDLNLYAKTPVSNTLLKLNSVSKTMVINQV